MKVHMGVVAWSLLVGLTAQAQEGIGRFQGAGMRVEDALNEEEGEMEHRLQAWRFPKDGFTTWRYGQDWSLFSERHQFEWRISAQDLGPRRRGWGDLEVGYVYQAMGGEDARSALGLGLMAVLPTGDWRRGFGAGAPGLELEIPYSRLLGERWAWHLNVGAAWIPRARTEEGERHVLREQRLAQGLVFQPRPGLQLLLEAEVSEEREGSEAWEREAWVQPGLRVVKRLSPRLAIAPAIGFPIGVGRRAGEWGIVFQLSFEHRFQGR